jgi:hypothetical protein
MNPFSLLALATVT